MQQVDECCATGNPQNTIQAYRTKCVEGTIEVSEVINCGVLPLERTGLALQQSEEH